MDDDRVRTGDAALAGDAPSAGNAALAGDAPPEDASDDDTIEVAGGVVAAGRRMINEDWAATALGLVLLALVLLGVIGKGLVP